MSNWLSLTAHYTIHLAASDLFIAFLIGWSVMTRIGFAWKYGRSFQEAMIRAKVIFLMPGYFTPAP